MIKQEKFIIEPHFRLQEWVAEEKGYFKDEGLDYIFQEPHPIEPRRTSLQGRQGRRHAVIRARPRLRRKLRLPLDRRRNYFLEVARTGALFAGSKKGGGYKTKQR
jgi:hypothetical protein